MGSSSGVGGYKLWCLREKKIVTSRDVTFDEALMLKMYTVKNVDSSEDKKNAVSKVVQTKLATSWKPEVTIPVESSDSCSEDEEIPVEEISQRQVLSLASGIERKALLASQRLGYGDSMAGALAVYGRELFSYQDTVAVSHCGEGKTAIGNLDFCKMSERKKSVVVRCMRVLADKDGGKDSGTEIVWERKKRRLCLKQRQYLDKVVVRFGMQDEEPVCVPLITCFKLSRTLIPSTEEVVEYMVQVPDARAVEDLMDTMVDTQPDNARVLSIKGRFRANPWKLHWNAVRWIVRYLQESRDIRVVKFEHGLTEVYVFRW